MVRAHDTARKIFGDRLMPQMTRDQYQPTLFERIVDNLVEFFGSLLGLPAVINRPLHFDEPYEPSPSRPRRPDASAWRREKRYQDQQRLATAREIPQRRKADAGSDAE